MTQPELGPACRAVSQLWDDAVQMFLDSGERPPHLDSWFRSYRGGGKGAVERNAMPEPFLGSLATKPRGVILALNPGKADLCFQGRTGIFADEIRTNGGSYTRWAASWPYFREAWIERKRRNQHHERRLQFIRNWLDDQELSHSAMVSFELYPWHSDRFSGRLDCEAAGKFFAGHIRDALVELDAPVFAFGARWFPILKHARSGLEVDERLDGERPYCSCVASRRVMLLRGDGGLNVIAVKQMGYAGPPSRDETLRLRDVVTDICS